MLTKPLPKCDSVNAARHGVAGAIYSGPLTPFGSSLSHVSLVLSLTPPLSTSLGDPHLMPSVPLPQCDSVSATQFEVTGAV